MNTCRILLIISLFVTSNCYADMNLSPKQNVWMNRSLFCLQQINSYLVDKESLEPMVAFAVQDFDKSRLKVMLSRKEQHIPTAESLRQYYEYLQQTEYPKS
ncbi:MULTISPECIES: hypothetical protein [unclassified Photobacterium]|uniref:hypothetical protein n=1 Tax=unclassified Photobacterium TaxID=2628852 RepID=UPI001EDF62E7|nr:MULTISPECIES: hypothetical protein [unclassified Photobacterium]MCG3863658.1 hypothetical protein [Photobacterium sp. Ph6]MCG3875243.1 hypothetical protein [Photobacterium sp. Ph5]